MATTRADDVGLGSRTEHGAVRSYTVWTAWPINWSAVWVGALTALALVIMFGLLGIAVGAHQLGPENRVVDLRKFGIAALIFSVFGAFLSFAAAGWVTAKIAGIQRAESAILHGAIAWLIADCARDSRVAAARKLPASATVMKVRIWSSVSASSMIDFLDRPDANYLTFRDRSKTTSPGDAAAQSRSRT